MNTSIELLSVNNNFNDLTVVNAARVSFNKQKNMFNALEDSRLIRYLVNHEHWTPLAHPHATIIVPKALIDYSDLITRYRILAGLVFYEHISTDDMEITGSLWGLLQLGSYLGSKSIIDICHEHCPVSTAAYIDKYHNGTTKDFDDDGPFVRYAPKPSVRKHDVFSFRVTAPIYVARQLVKHKEKLVWNEISGRYVPLDIGVEIPDSWTAPADNVKQGSSDTIVVPKGRDYELVVDDVLDWYKANEGHIANEQRRKILPVSTYTSWVWTGIRGAFSGMVKLRTSPDAQKETAIVAEQIEQHLLFA